ncbi:MAG: methyltransferase domain-containing protein [Pseudomonadales bacterium]|nr:methyltransferase domain-containing protein [Pseudomonadales bacterium]
MAVKKSAKHAKTAEKQKKATKNNTDHVLKYKGVKAFKSTHPDIKKLRRQNEAPSIHGNKIWDSSYVLMDFLRRWPPGDDLTIMDIGCGWGVLSSYLAKQFDANVIGLDADEAVQPYFDYHAQENNVDLAFSVGTMKSIKKSALSDIDVLVGADICFWPELGSDWKKLIKRALDAGVEQIYIADPGRSPFWDLVKHCEKKFDGQVWSHDIKKPFESEKYILEIVV